MIKQRYSRQMLINNWDIDKQNILKRSKVFVAGCGALGNIVIPYLTAAGCGEITYADFDKISESNLNRQIIYKEENLNQPKVKILTKHLEQLNSETHLIPLELKITSQNVNFLKETDLIIDCLDNISSRLILNKAALKFQKPLIHGGINGFYGQTFFMFPQKTACLACFLKEEKRTLRKPSLSATAGIIGSMQTNQALKYLTNIGNTELGVLNYWDGLNNSWEKIFIPPQENCNCRNKTS